MLLIIDDHKITKPHFDELFDLFIHTGDDLLAGNVIALYGAVYAQGIGRGHHHRKTDDH